MSNIICHLSFLIGCIIYLMQNNVAYSHSLTAPFASKETHFEKIIEARLATSVNTYHLKQQCPTVDDKSRN